MTSVNTNIFSGLKDSKDLTRYVLMRGVPDFTNLNSVDYYETGYAFLVTVGIPRFLEMLGSENSDYEKLINNYLHVLEYDFKSLSGIEDITSDTSQITNNISTIEVMTKANMQSNSTFSMQYNERTGSLFSKVHELFIRGIKDPRTQVKTYLGLIQSGKLEASFENEIFSFMYFVTDNTLMNIERAYFLAACQPTSAQHSQYNYTKGDINFVDVNVEFRGYPITGRKVTEKAQELLDWIRDNTEWVDSEFDYEKISDLKPYKSDLITSNGSTVAF